jgi:predicted amidohydrolase YtcJ
MAASRRDFVFGLGALGALSMVSWSMDRTEPEIVLYNGNFWTVDPRQPRAQAVAISGGRFLAIGSNEEVLPLAAGNAKKIDLGGKTVLPGFIDAHSHPAEAGFRTCAWWIAICDPLPTFLKRCTRGRQKRLPVNGCWASSTMTPRRPKGGR